MEVLLYFAVGFLRRHADTCFFMNEVFFLKNAFKLDYLTIS